MNRETQIIEAMGLGPVWQPREAMFCDHPALRRSDIETSIENNLESHESEMPAQSAKVQPTSSDIETATPLAQLTQPAIENATVQAPQALSIVDFSDLRQLQHAVAECSACRLCKTRGQTVFGRGNPDARWLLIGEAPGEQEDQQGQPFVGRAGRLLDNILSAASLSSEHDVYIANVLKCRPPGNRNPAEEEIAACQHFLQQQIRLIKPDIIVALGRFAAQTLLNSELSISRLRGSAHDYQGIPLIVSYHPAYLLRNPPDKAKAWADFLFARQLLNASK